MTSIVWSRSFETGDLFIDNQHRKLVSTVNELGAAYEQCAGRSNIARILNDLTNMSVVHFQDEIRPSTLDFLPMTSLVREDQRIVSFISRLRIEYINGLCEITDHDIMTIANWLVRHIRIIERAHTAVAV
ncbi:MAG: hemerythrin domain-containing protein [Candidatus Zixiibacteriota bacterium]